MSDAPQHDYEALTPPWPEGPSIYELLRDAGPASGEVELPDADARARS